MFGRVCIIIDKIGKIPMDDIRKDLLSADMSEDAIEELLQVLSLKSLAKLEEKLGATGEALSDLKQLFSLAEKYGYSEWLQFDASIVRGLAYYTGIVFEGFDREGKLRAICGGGRYDRLLSTFGGDDLPACGFGFGDAVIVEDCILDLHIATLVGIGHEIDPMCTQTWNTITTTTTTFTKGFNQGILLNFAYFPEVYNLLFHGIVACTKMGFSWDKSY